MTARTTITARIHKVAPMGAWTSRAACLDTEPEAFFPVGDALPGPEAIEACEACPVQAECLAYALDARCTGYWGATTDDERDVMRRKAQRAAQTAAKRAEAEAGEPGGEAAEPDDGEAAA